MWVEDFLQQQLATIGEEDHLDPVITGILNVDNPDPMLQNLVSALSLLDDLHEVDEITIENINFNLRILRDYLDRVRVAKYVVAVHLASAASGNGLDWEAFFDSYTSAWVEDEEA